MTSYYYAMGFSAAEREELLAILPPKYANRVRTAVGFMTDPFKVAGPVSLSYRYESGVTEWISPRHPNPEKLMEPSPVGRRVRCASRGRSGIVTSQWVDHDDCSGGFGTLRFDLDHANPMNNSCSVPASQCEFLD